MSNWGEKLNHEVELTQKYGTPEQRKVVEDKFDEIMNYCLEEARKGKKEEIIERDCPFFTFYTCNFLFENGLPLSSEAREKVMKKMTEYFDSLCTRNNIKYTKEFEDGSLFEEPKYIYTFSW